jgi:hypothetical protein
MLAGVFYGGFVLSVVAGEVAAIGKNIYIFFYVG